MEIEREKKNMITLMCTSVSPLKNKKIFLCFISRKNSVNLMINNSMLLRDIFLYSIISFFCLICKNENNHRIFLGVRINISSFLLILTRFYS